MTLNDKLSSVNYQESKKNDSTNIIGKNSPTFYSMVSTLITQRNMSIIKYSSGMCKSSSFKQSDLSINQSSNIFHKISATAVLL